MNENWSLHLTLLNNRTGQKIGANYPKNKYEILEMLDRLPNPLWEWRLCPSGSSIS